jgi:hypothetical protein
MTNKVAKQIWHIYFMPLYLLLSLTIGGLTSLHLGQDASWDLRNYHIHNAWAFLNNRMEIDIYTAGIQTYFNPLLDLVYYKVGIEWFPDNPRFVAFLSGFPAGVLLFFVCLCVSDIIRVFKVDNLSAILLTIIAVSIGMTGAATISQLGTSSNEIQTAILVVVGVYSIIKNIDLEESNLIWFVTAGVCLGVAAGLKLTATIYAPGAFLAIVFMTRRLRFCVYRSIGFCTGWVSGFMVFYGWWGCRLYDLTGSPLFPLFNALFKSPLSSSLNFTDPRFKPTGFVETFFYPFHWIFPHSNVVAEPTFSDPRFAAAYVALLFIGLAYVYCRINKGLVSIDAFSGEKVVPRKASTLIIWLIFSYMLWQFMFSNIRYAVPMEVFTGLVIVIGILVIAQTLNFSKNRLSTAAMLAALGLLCNWYAQYPSFGRISYGRAFLEVDNVVFPNNSLVVFNGSPGAYLAPFLVRGNTGISFVGMTEDLLQNPRLFMGSIISKRLREHSGNMYVVEHPDQRVRDSHLSEFGLAINRTNCRKYNSSLALAFSICELQKTAN